MRTVYLMLAALSFGGLVGFIIAILLSQFSAEDDKENKAIELESRYYKKMIQLEADNKKLAIENAKLKQANKLKDAIIRKGAITNDCEQIELG